MNLDEMKNFVQQLEADRRRPGAAPAANIARGGSQAGDNCHRFDMPGHSKEQCPLKDYDLFKCFS